MDINSHALNCSCCLCVQFLGLHGHSDESGDRQHSHSNNEQPEIPVYIYKMLVLMSGIYYFYLMETIFSIITYKDHHHDQHHHAVRKNTKAKQTHTNMMLIRMRTLTNHNITKTCH